MAPVTPIPIAGWKTLLLLTSCWLCVLLDAGSEAQDSPALKLIRHDGLDDLGRGGAILVESELGKASLGVQSLEMDVLEEKSEGH